MDLTPYVDDLRDRLLVAAEAGGDDARELARRLTAPLDAAVRLVLLDALSTAVGEISADLAPGSVDLLLRGGEPELVVRAESLARGQDATWDQPPTPAPATVAATEADEGGTTRTTLRLPDHLKTRVEAAAARDGVSVNSWLVRAVAAALDQRDGRPEARRAGNRLTGWVR